ncbi:hypothetical protein K8354_15240 [Polaribacter litorisediminis]|uniref:hypothetical protein n=1 Tax=Polaribacter litorisediminis TaxID=1908341 RepID=UPI001CBBA37F|nr:hypothetical protein [Polaribacter litorisediminis]UAM97639.1 hypothetical protein K8354_15240 [Polaribacter litorisediminis]
MKTKIANPKTALLLEAGLNVLHFESVEWLDTIAFWKDEVKFFYKILSEKESSEKNNSDYHRMLKTLDKIHLDLFDDLEHSIIEHEKLLSKIEQGHKGVSDYEYREKHRHIYARMDTFTNDFKNFKRVVFQYIKGL